MNKNNHWFELNGIRVTVRRYDNGYIITRSDNPEIWYMNKDGKPFQTREVAKEILGYIYQSMCEEEMWKRMCEEEMLKHLHGLNN